MYAACFPGVPNAWLNSSRRYAANYAHASYKFRLLPKLNLINNLTGVGPTFAGDIAPVPDSPNSIAVASVGLAVYDDGVRRPKLGPSGLNSTIEFSDSPARLYGAQRAAGGYDFGGSNQSV